MRIIVGFFTGVLGMLAGWAGLASLVMALGGRDRDGGIAMAAVLSIGPIGGALGFIAGVLLFVWIGIKREKTPAPAPGAAAAVLEQPPIPAPTRISRPFAVIVLIISGVLGFAGWWEFIRSPYLTHGADAEMTLAMQFRLPPGTTLPANADELELMVEDGDGRASTYYGESWFGARKWRALDGDREVLFASAELNKITYWRKVTLQLPNAPAQIWTLDLDANPYPVPDYTPWEKANAPTDVAIEMRFRLTADRCAVCAFLSK
ncbi:MAG TPA: hypothetical protein VFB45_26490 [Pseudolabrys sp.]|nr:hypothetical protein [Pseudolabrys sp.]